MKFFSGIGLLARKEVKSYFFSPMVYLLSALFLFLIGWIFFNSLILTKNQQGASLAVTVLPSLFGNMSFLFMVVTPLLTMRLFAEEKKNHTLSLLLNSSLSHWQIVLGKLLGAFTVMLFMVSLTLIFPLILARSSSVDISVLVTGYLGTLLNVLGFLSVGMFASMLTENQIISALLSFCLLFAFLLLSYAPFVVGNFMAGQILGYISIPTHFEAFTRGVFRSMDLVYYFSFIGLMVFFTHETLESRHW